MIHDNPTTKVHAFHVLWVVVLLSLGLADGLSAQSEAQPSPQPEAVTKSANSSTPNVKPATKKVWTNDNLANVRKPSDVYQDEKATAQQAAEAAAKLATTQKQADAARDAAATLSDNSHLPKTVEETEAKIQQTLSEIQRKNSFLDKTTQDYQSAATDVERSELKTSINIGTLDLKYSQDDLKLLQTHLALLKAGASQPTTPVQQNAPTSPSKP